MRSKLQWRIKQELVATKQHKQATAAAIVAVRYELSLSYLGFEVLPLFAMIRSKINHRIMAQ